MPDGKRLAACLHAVSRESVPRLSEFHTKRVTLEGLNSASGFNAGKGTCNPTFIGIRAWSVQLRRSRRKAAASVGL